MADAKWKVRRSMYPLRSPWLSVRADECTTVRGHDVSPFYVLELSDFVHVLATVKDQVVLVRQYRHGASEWTLELPGGAMDTGENDPVAVAARELREETGYRGGTWTYVMALSIDPARYANRLHFVRADSVSAGAAKPDATEDIETVLVSRDEALQLVRSGKIINAAHAAMIFMGLT